MEFKTPANEMRTRFASIKERGFRRSFREDGAIDLASIMVGVLVMGILGAVIAAAVFAVIPWSQDNAAQSNLDAIKTAESVQFTMSSGVGAGGDYGNETLLSGTGNASAKSLISAGVNGVAIASSAPLAAVDYYIAASLSATGKKFYIFSNNPSKVYDEAGAAAGLSAFNSSFTPALTQTLPAVTTAD